MRKECLRKDDRNNTLNYSQKGKIATMNNQ